MNLTKTVIITAAAIAVTALLLLLFSCGSTPPVDPCQINPTRTTAAGQWVEADGEPLDSDPCDSDDLGESNHKKPKPKKPTTTNRKPYK